MVDLTRRIVLTGAMATAVETAIVPTANAAVEDPLADFIAASAKLTGIDPKKLRPDMAPIPIYVAYFDRAKRDPAFALFLAAYRANLPKSDTELPKPDADITAAILNDSGTEVRYLARSIMLMWYLGAWYAPNVLAEINAGTISSEFAPAEVLSPAAYTQGWTWRVAQAHPMGYSELTFGYWEKVPPGLPSFIGGQK
jgi:hypothetical protein